MAIAHVQTVNGQAAGTTALSSGSITTTAGHAVIVAVLTYFQPTNVAWTQTSGDTLTQRVGFISGGLLCKLYDNLNVAGGATTYGFTLNASASNATIYVSEFSGIATSSAFDVSANGGAHAVAVDHATGTTATTAQAVELAYATVNYDGTGTLPGVNMTGSTGTYTIPTNGSLVGSGVTGVRSAVAYQILAATGAQSATFHISDGTTTADGDAIIGTWKGAAGGGGGRGLFMTAPVSGIGVGGSFFRNPLQAPYAMVRRESLFVPAWLGAAA